VRPDGSRRSGRCLFATAASPTSVSCAVKQSVKHLRGRPAAVKRPVKHRETPFGGQNEPKTAGADLARRSSPAIDFAHEFRPGPV